MYMYTYTIIHAHYIYLITYYVTKKTLHNSLKYITAGLSALVLFNFVTSFLGDKKSRARFIYRVYINHNVYAIAMITHTH